MTTEKRLKIRTWTLSILFLFLFVGSHTWVILADQENGEETGGNRENEPTESILRKIRNNSAPENGENLIENGVINQVDDSPADNGEDFPHGGEGVIFIDYKQGVRLRCADCDLFTARDMNNGDIVVWGGLIRQGPINTPVPVLTNTPIVIPTLEPTSTPTLNPTPTNTPPAILGQTIDGCSIEAEEMEITGGHVEFARHPDLVSMGAFADFGGNPDAFIRVPISSNRVHPDGSIHLSMLYAQNLARGVLVEIGTYSEDFDLPITYGWQQFLWANINIPVIETGLDFEPGQDYVVTLRGARGSVLANMDCFHIRYDPPPPEATPVGGYPEPPPVPTLPAGGYE